MAKKSAKSKGYRKTVQKKPFLTKKEIIELIVLVAAIALVVVLFNLFYDDGYLREGDVQPNDLVSYVSREITSRYVKLGEVNELEGFTRESEQGADAVHVTHVYLPEGDNPDHIDSINVAGNFNDASRLANDQTTVYALDDYTFSEVQTASIQGHDAYIYSLTYDYYSAEEAGEAPAEGDAAEDSGEEPASNVYAQAINCYVDVGDYSVCLYINRTGDDASCYIPDGELADYAARYAAAFTITDDVTK